ncbi:MAG: PDZ domain-containing protein [Gemmataceae bacterium]
MRVILGLTLLALGIASAPAGDEPTADQLLAAVQKRLKNCINTAGPSIATVVVSRSEHYPKVANADTPGKLGGFDPKELLKGNPTAERARLAQSLDLSEVRNIADHGYAGGVVIDPAGYVLTPYHVIDGATRVYVFLQGGVGSYADIHAADARADLAVLKLINPPPKLQPIKFADVRIAGTGNKDATVFKGKLCLLMTNPYSSTFGLGSPTAGFGSITNVRFRTVAKDIRPGRYSEFGYLLEYDIRPNAGVTGGVLLNLDGEMIGLTNAAAVAWGNEIGPGYAMPADANFHRIVEVLRKGEEVEYGFLGVTLSPERLGVRVRELTAHGPAVAAGIEVGDEIVKVNGAPIENFDDLLLQVGSALAGSKVKIAVSRFGRPRELEATLAKYRHEQPFIASVRPEAVFGLHVDYSDLQTRILPTGGTSWVCVRDVVPDSPAAAKFKALGDNPQRWQITHVNGQALMLPADFYKAAKGQEKLKLTLLDSTDMNPRPREITLP